MAVTLHGLPVASGYAIENEAAVGELTWCEGQIVDILLCG